MNKGFIDYFSFYEQASTSVQDYTKYVVCIQNNVTSYKG